MAAARGTHWVFLSKLLNAVEDLLDGLLYDWHQKQFCGHRPGFEEIAAQVRLDEICFDARAQIIFGKNVDERTAATVRKDFRLNRQQQAHCSIEFPRPFLDAFSLCLPPRFLRFHDLGLSSRVTQGSEADPNCDDRGISEINAIPLEKRRTKARFLHRQAATRKREGVGP
jgi:hypothetical protein